MKKKTPPIEIAERPSPNFNERRIAGSPRFLILHYTDMENAGVALDRLCDPAAEVSAHYVIEEHGVIHRLVHEDKRAWHAGASFWDGEANVNSHSVGIELVNPGHSHGYRKFPAAQMGALIRLTRDIVARHNIHPTHILGHSDVAPSRKIDPGILFDWELLAKAGIGAWPAPDALDYETAAELVGNERWLSAMLVSYGYAPDNTFLENMTAFQRHFQSEVFLEPERIGHPDLETIARLSSLLRRKQETPIVAAPDGRTAAPVKKERKVRASRKHGAG